MNEQCERGHWKTVPDKYGWRGDETEEIFIRDCRLETIHTFLDRCTVCGKEFTYTNTHNYPTIYRK